MKSLMTFCQLLAIHHFPTLYLSFVHCGGVCVWCVGFGIRSGEQSHPGDQLCGDAASQLLGGDWSHVLDAELAGRRETDTF